ncbi:MAG: arylsulfatase [Prolixibacteraceae bacterium]|nr:arylsulfatase [Prolixibacteraceae bacterium]
MSKLNRRQFIQSSALTTAGMSFFGAGTLFAKTAGKPIVRKPHIILIMTDQHRGDTLGCMGNKVIKTPHIDSIAADGVCFVNGFSSTPSCTPARTGLLTGLAPWNHGMLGYGVVARKYKFEMPQMLRDLGYYTFGIGKMHWYPQKALHGFHGTLVDESGRVEQEGFVSDYHDWFKLQAPGENPDKTGIGWNDHRAGVFQLDEKLHPTAWTGQTAVQFIQNYQQENPLFLKISFARPHSPYDPPQRYLDLYKNAEIPEPAIGHWAEPFGGYPETPDAAFGNFGKAHAVNSRRHYYANVSFIDDQVGEIIQALKKKGMYDNAVICFTSDHGDMLGDHHHWRKTYAYQGSASIPFLLKWPRTMETQVKRGSRLNHPVELRDFLPTFLDAAGSEAPADMDGKSLLNLIRDKKADWRKFIDLEHATTYQKENYWCALTDGKIKYIWFFYTGKEQLFDLAADPNELSDLSGNAKYQEPLEAWRAEMVTHLSERGESFVKDGKLVQREKTMVLSPNYPKETRGEKEFLKSWQLDVAY